MKLYGHPMSTCTRKVLATLDEKGVNPEFIVIEYMKGEGKKPAHLARQPFGEVPAIDHDGFVLYESRAINRYLDEVLPGPSLTPKDPKGRALMEQWISVEAANFTPHATTILYQLLFGPMRGAQPDMAKVTEAKSRLSICADVLDTQLTDGPHILGEQFTLADIGYMPCIGFLMTTSLANVISSRPHLAAWWKLVSARPSWKMATGTI